ncbi:hypothetical protein, partial [uncultured Thiodictyon sp.]|uniref:hypothetical protein n=1 Tax=uncultured Thiodictyon sp. TaxID=1846217 RepID=UPI0025E1946F
AIEQEQTFALCFGNREMFPEHLISTARQELTETVAKLGYKSLVMPADATPLGAVKTVGPNKPAPRLSFCGCSR